MLYVAPRPILTDPEVPTQLALSCDTVRDCIFGCAPCVLLSCCQAASSAPAAATTVPPTAGED
jgi:hypothetical protein